MKSEIKDLINSCNNCILNCEKTLESCHNCVKLSNEESCSTEISENCSVDCQELIDACQKCMHQCNQILEHKLYSSTQQEMALKNCGESCKESIKRCQIATSKILDKERLLGCQWALDSLNKCIASCDECIESFE